AGVVVDHHLVDSAQTIMMPLAKRFVFHSKSPVRIALRKSAVGRDLVHLLVVAHLEDGGEEIKAIRAGLLADLVLGGEEFGGKWVECVARHVKCLCDCLKRSRDPSSWRLGQTTAVRGIRSILRKARDVLPIYKDRPVREGPQVSGLA